MTGSTYCLLITGQARTLKPPTLPLLIAKPRSCYWASVCWSWDSNLQCCLHLSSHLGDDIQQTIAVSCSRCGSLTKAWMGQSLRNDQTRTCPTRLLHRQAQSIMSDAPHAGPEIKESRSLWWTCAFGIVSPQTKRGWVGRMVRPNIVLKRRFCDCLGWAGAARCIVQTDTTPWG